MSNTNPFNPGLPALPQENGSETFAWQGQRPPQGDQSALKVTVNGKLPEPSMDLKTLLKAFQRQWLPAVGLGLLLMVIVGGIAFLVVPSSKYVSKSTLLVSTVKPKIVFETLENSMDFPTYQKTQVALIQSRMVLGAVLRDPKVAQLQTVREQLDPMEWLEKDLKVEFPFNSTVLSVSMSGDNPADLAVIVNMVTDKYMELVVDDEKRLRRKRLEELQTVLEKETARLRELRDQLRNRTVNVGSSNEKTLLAKQQFELETLAFEQREKMTTDTKVKLADIKVKVLEAMQNGVGNDPNASPTALSPQLEADAVLQRLMADREALVGKITSLERKARNKNDASFREPRNELKVLERAIDDRKNLLASKGPAALAPGTPGAAKQTDLDVARLERDALIQYDQLLEQDIRARESELKVLNLTTQDMQTDSEAIALVASTTGTIGKEVEVLKLELNAPERVRVMNKAEVPKQKDESKRYKMCAGAALGAFALGIFGVSFWEYRSRRVYSTQEVVNSLGLNLVGTLPALPTTKGRTLSRRGQAALDRWHSLMVESIDATRTMLMHVARVEGLRAVMITSALKGEGKTSLSSHLATSLARAGLRTLLVDCDLRNPSAHRLYDLPPEPGLCELLRGEIGLEEVIVEVVGPSPLGTLSVLPAGRCDPQALSALAQDGMRNLLDTLKTQYDFVIVDSAPVLPVADTLLLGQQVDAVLFSILRDVSRVHHVHAAYDRLSRLGVRMLGAVINGENPSTYGSRYSYGYTYGRVTYGPNQAS